MSRLSDNIEVKGVLKEGFDYDIQVWVKDYIVQHCGHHSSNMFHPSGRGHCCTSSEYAGKHILTVRSELLED